MDMEVSIPLQDTLRAVARAMGAAQEPWWIIASAAVALHGATHVAVGDVDVLLGTGDACRILLNLGIEPQRGSDYPDFRSDVFGTLRESPLAVEFMAGFRHWQAGEWKLVQPLTRQQVRVADVVVYVPERSELRDMLEAFGRPKDYERARLLSTLS